jgi:hypothetical protein
MISTRSTSPRIFSSLNRRSAIAVLPAPGRPPEGSAAWAGGASCRRPPPAGGERLDSRESHGEIGGVRIRRTDPPRLQEEEEVSGRYESWRRGLNREGGQDPHEFLVGQCHLLEPPVKRADEEDCAAAEGPNLLDGNRPCKMSFQEDGLPDRHRRVGVHVRPLALNCAWNWVRLPFPPFHPGRHPPAAEAPR